MKLPFRFKRPARKFSFRLTLTTILLALVLLTVGGLGAVSYWNTRGAADELTAQVLEETSNRIDEKVHAFLETAEELGRLNRQFVQSGRFRELDTTIRVERWLEQMRTYPELQGLSVNLEESGEWLYIHRTPEGGLVVGEGLHNPDTKALDLVVHNAEGYAAFNGPVRMQGLGANTAGLLCSPLGPGPLLAVPALILERPLRTLPHLDRDTRQLPWYRTARETRGQVWTETFTLFGPDGFPEMPGILCATPFYEDEDPNKRLLGVYTSTIAVKRLSDYVKAVHVGKQGFAFIVELGADGRRQVVAYPDADKLLRPVPGKNGETFVQLASRDELGDARVSAFLDALPMDLVPAEHRDQVYSLPPFTLDGVAYLAGYRALSSPANGIRHPNWLIGIVLPAEEVVGGVDRNTRYTLWIGLAVTIAAVLLGLMISRTIARPLEALAREAAAIGEWRLEPRPVPDSPVLEVHRLQRAGEEMKTSLRSFQKYVPTNLVRQLLAAGQEAKVGGENRMVTIFFSDVADFTALAEGMPPDRLMEHLGEYLQAFSDEVQATGGTVDKYIGDAVMAFWGAPLPLADHALAACQAALRCQKRMETLRAKWAAEGKPAWFARIGLHTGEAVVGNVGSDTRLNYTVIGDAVNLASRMEGLNKYYGTQILVTASTYDVVREAMAARPIDWVSVKGKTAAVLTYELLGVRGEVEPATEEAVAVYAQALELYRRQEWAKARDFFEQVRRLRPDDGPAGKMILRCDQYQVKGPGDAWDGVHRMQSK